MITFTNVELTLRTRRQLLFLRIFFVNYAFSDMVNLNDFRVPYVAVPNCIDA